MDTERGQNPRIEDMPKDKTTIELPAVIFEAADILLRGSGARSRTQLILSVIWWGINMDPAEAEHLLREYRRARISDIMPPLTVNELPLGRKLGRPRKNSL